MTKQEITKKLREAIEKTPIKRLFGKFFSLYPMPTENRRKKATWIFLLILNRKVLSRILLLHTFKDTSKTKCATDSSRTIEEIDQKKEREHASRISSNLRIGTCIRPWLR